jgi:hypothetical protein
MVFSMFFFLGSILAGTGWFAEIRDLPLGLGWAIIAGHALQVIGAFGLLLIPDRNIENSEPEKAWPNDPEV